MASITTGTNAIGTGVGAVIAVATAPLWVPALGLGALAAAVGTVGVAAAGGAIGWWATKPKPETIQQLVSKHQ